MSQATTKPVSELARKLAEKVFEDLCHVSWEQECIRPQRKELFYRLFGSAEYFYKDTQGNVGQAASSDEDCEDCFGK